MHPLFIWLMHKLGFRRPEDRPDVAAELEVDLRRRGFLIGASAIALAPPAILEALLSRTTVDMGRHAATDLVAMLKSLYGKNELEKLVFIANPLTGLLTTSTDFSFGGIIRDPFCPPDTVYVMQKFDVEKHTIEIANAPVFEPTKTLIEAVPYLDISPHEAYTKLNPSNPRLPSNGALSDGDVARMFGFAK